MPYFYDYYDYKKLEHFLKNVEKAIYTPIAVLNVEAWITPEPVPFEVRTSGEHRALAFDQPWGKLWDCAWMHLTGTVPTTIHGQPVVLLIDFNGEGCIVDEQGTPRLGLTTVNSEYDKSLGLPGKRVVPFTAHAIGGESVDLWLDAGANDLFGKFQENGILREASIAILHEAIRSLYYDAFVLYELMLNLPEHSARRAHILVALYEASQILRDFTESEAEQAQQRLTAELDMNGGTPSLKVSAIGHAHIDLAWLWPIRETMRKGARTFATALAMLTRYPDYIFGASQPQLYQWVKDRYPKLYSEIKPRVAEGRWEVQGGMWVEPDVNVAGGEALIRQILYGKRFFRQEFGKDVKTLWLPDVFGYTGALPQLMKKSGLDYFMTTKISWSKFNQFPHHTFVWQGIDGSRVLAHMPPEGTYNSSAAPRAVAALERGFRDKYVSDRALMLFGIGDGGGGPGEEHLERLAREKNLDGIAPVVQETAESFFRQIEKDAGKYKTWVGELYLEFHQGTLTSQARNKRLNRKLEIALRELEWMAVLAERSAPTGAYEYPAALETIWKEMLLYQFHDILPGSSIKRVYDESLVRYQALMDEVGQLTEQADTAFVACINTTNFQKPAVVTNSLSWDRAAWLQIEDRWLNVTVPAMGYLTVDLAAMPSEVKGLNSAATTLENDQLRVQFGENGAIVSVFDKVNQREVIAESLAANVLAVYDDPGDAWDFPFDYAQRAPRRFELVSVEASMNGPQAIVYQRYRFGSSTLSQKISLMEGSRRLDFVTEVDWHEHGKMLRTSFPLTILAAEATCDIQFGTIKRLTHGNTSWDMAKYEIAAHKWVDLSESTYGVALLNDCKYGCHVTENTLDLNLLRSPHYPDGEADQAVHQFTYALYPHIGDHVQGKVARAGYELNVPLRWMITDAHSGILPANGSTLYVEAENVIVEAVKKAEDSDATIVRLYEANGGRVTTRLDFNMRLASATLVTLMEEPLTVLEVYGHSTTVPFGPFEIQSVKVSY